MQALDRVLPTPRLLEREVWQLEIPFVHVPDAEAYRAFTEPGWVKVAWSLRAEPLGAEDTRLVVEVRVDATDEASWKKLEAYFALIGPGSRLIRRGLLRAIAKDLRTPEAVEDERPLAADELLPDAAAQLTDGITIRAAPEAIWPWLVQMGCDRAGYYSHDALDNARRPSAREIHPELQELRVGDVLPARPGSKEGFEVLRLDPPRALVLGGLHDLDAGRQLPFAAARPPRFWQVTWAFVLEPLDASTTRLHVRVRAATSGAPLRLLAARPVHRFMEHAQLRNLAARVEGRLPRDDVRDVLAGLGGAAAMVGSLVTPFLAGMRAHWGLDAAKAARPHPGDELVPHPRWGWTHAVEIDAPPSEVWPWVAQVGADRGGFYSYQWLENVVGCDVRNAEAIHPEWALREGDGLRLHPAQEPLRVVRVEEDRLVLAFGPPDEAARAAGKPWTAASWLFLVEPLEGGRSRLVSRFRVDCSDDVATWLAMGPALLEPIGFVMDRRMLLRVKERAERLRHEALRSAGRERDVVVQHAPR